MNVFIIPSWYPSDTNPAWGIFCKEQADALAYCYPNDNFGISLWGQNNSANLLYLNDPLGSILKILKIGNTEPSIIFQKENLVEYNTPALTWTKKIFNGNIKGIVKANEANFNAFQNTFGKVDIIHAHVGYPAGYIAYHLSEAFKIPYVITEHMSPFPLRYFINKGKLSHELMTSLISASKIIAVSEALKKTIASFGPRNIDFIPNLVNEDFFTLSESERADSEKFTFFFLGSMISRKGVDVFLNAVQKMKNLKAIQIEIGGDGELWDQFKKLAVELGINDRIKWLGFLDREETLDAFQRSDVFVLSSRNENLPMVLLEAIACGKPIISTKCEGPEIIVNENNGLLVEVDDSNGLASAMAHIKENYSFYKPEIIRKDFEARFSRASVTSEIMKLYHEVTAEFRSEN